MKTDNNHLALTAGSVVPFFRGNDTIEAECLSLGQKNLDVFKIPFQRDLPPSSPMDEEVGQVVHFSIRK